MFHKSLALFFGFWKTTYTFFPSSQSLNVLHDALFVVCFCLNTLFLLFWAFLTCNCSICAYIVAVFTVNTPSRPYCLFFTTENVPLTFGFVLWLLKNDAHLFSNLETSKYLRQHFLCCLFPFKYVISARLWHFNL